MKNNNLIDRYVQEVGRYLPKKIREDVKLEIKGALEDLLDEGSLDANRDSSEIEKILVDYGDPEKVAAGYLPEKWLIGPKIYPTFEMAIKIALTVIFGLSLLSFSVSVFRNEFNFMLLGRLFENLSSGLFTALGVVVLVFIILERLGLGEEKDMEIWQPKSLPEIEDLNQFKRREIIISILFTVAALIIFNYFPKWIGIYGSRNGEWVVVARLASEFSVHIPWLSVLWGLEIALYVALLRNGAWDKLSRIAEFSLSAFGIFILYRILTGGAVMTLATIGLIVKGALLIALVVSVIELIGQAWRIIRSFLPQEKAIAESTLQ